MTAVTTAAAFTVGRRATAASISVAYRRAVHCHPPPAAKHNSDQCRDYLSARDLSINHVVAAGLHLGHSWNDPKLRSVPYVLGRRHGVSLFDPHETLAHLRRAAAFVRIVSGLGGIVCFVSTRPEFQDIAIDAALHCSAYYVTHWTAGTLTNILNVVGSRTKAKSVPLPDVIVLFEAKSAVGAAAAREACSVKVPTIVITDSDVDPTCAAYPIPGNDDGILGVRLVAQTLAQAALEGLRVATALSVKSPPRLPDGMDP